MCLNKLKCPTHKILICLFSFQLALEGIFRWFLKVFQEYRRKKYVEKINEALPLSTFS